MGRERERGGGGGKAGEGQKKGGGRKGNQTNGSLHVFLGHIIKSGQLMERNKHRDREWQKWPITIVTGAYLGWGIGRFAGGYLFRGKRIKFD